MLKMKQKAIDHGITICVLAGVCPIQLELKL